MNSKGLLLVISGPSGVGKGTVCKEYVSRSENCFLSVSATTRKPRPGEEDGVNYFFMTEEAFKEKISNHGFLEHAVFCDNYYGTPRDEVMKMIDEGKDVILEIEVQGAMQVRSEYPEGVFIFVIPKDWQQLEDRLRSRNTESDEVILQRLARAREEFRYIEKYNYTLLNDNLEDAVNGLDAIIKAEKSSMRRNYENIQKTFFERN